MRCGGLASSNCMIIVDKMLHGLPKGLAGDQTSQPTNVKVDSACQGIMLCPIACKKRQDGGNIDRRGDDVRLTLRSCC